MAFTQFKNLGSVLTTYDISYRDVDFIIAEPVDLPDRLVEDVNFALQNTDYSVSEASICENLIYPVLKETWKSFLSDFFLWSHPTWYVDDVLSGIPDYLFSQPTKYGKAVMGAPILITVEAKKDNFQEGWGQCAAAMIAAQKINTQPDLIIYGIVSNGDKWEFAYLENKTITKNVTGYSIFELNKLYQALYFILKQSKKQLK
jgi:hypothetical protein